MSSLPYLRAISHVAQLGMTATLLTNSFLIHLTYHYIKNIFGAYKTMIILQAQIGIVFSVMHILINPFMHSYNASFAFFSCDDLFGASKQLKSTLLMIYSVVYAIITGIVTIQFIYRYQIVCNSPRIKLFKGRYAVIWIGYLSLFVAPWVISVIGTIPDDFGKSYLREELYVNYKIDVDELPAYFIVAFEPVKNVSTLRINAIMCSFGLSSVLFSQYVIMFYCGLKIRAAISSAVSATSLKNHRVQSELFKTLVIQISAPSIFYHIPAFVVYFAPYLDLTLSFPSGVMVVFFSVYPSLDSIILMWIVKEYGRVISGGFKKCLLAMAHNMKTEESEKEVRQRTSATL